jgi:isochorismate synthase EntC
VLLEMEKAVLKQATVQHLYSQMSGRLKAGCTEAALMAALHPTPAVCGQPQSLAKQMITAHEPFDRGFYAGPVGWLNGTR